MSMNIKIKDGNGLGSEASVTSRGQLVVAPLDFSSPFPGVAGAADTAVNIVEPIAGKAFIITEIILYANKSVGVNDATVELYEASTSNTIVVDKCIFNQEMVKQTTLALTGLNLLINKGKFVNLKTDDNSIFINVFGYYVED